ncbi:L,D-transpeptidase [Pararhizobium haloflavum]|uniref:L,D-transpeptidase n=1 Tax=Pararhizobium haloflavum TaxID=2037914 RepID=UPI000C19EAED|nr:L,D-transpeptidase [Pararhizobium haloflavum]
MMKQSAFLLLAILGIATMPAHAQDRYATRPPVVLSPDLSAPWVQQLYAPVPQTRAVHRRAPVVLRRAPAQPPRAVVVQPPAQRAVIAAPAQRPAAPELDPVFLPQQVAYSGGHAPGTVVIDTSRRFLYLVGSDGQARRYGVGVGKEGFGWSGSERITRKAEWPDWRPPAQMIARERAKGRILPAHMTGGPENPLGARALYLGSTLYRIHGTNAPWTIGQAVSSGCIRMRNEDVVDLYERVSVGTRVVVL